MAKSKSKSNVKQTISLFWQHATQYKRFLVPMIVLVPIVIIIGEFIEPIIISNVLQQISSNSYDVSDLWSSFGASLIYYALAVIASGIIGWRLVIYCLWSLELNVVRDISNRVFSHLMKLSPSFHANKFAGSLVSQSNKLTGAYVRFTDSTIFNLYTLIISLIATIVILAPKVPVYAAAMVIFSILYIIGTFHFAKPVRKANTKEAEAESRQTGYLADSVSNVMAVKGFSRSNFEMKRFWNVTSHTRKMGQNSVRATMIRESFSSVITSSIAIASLLIAIIGVKYLTIDIGTLFLMVSFTGSLGQRLWDFQNVLRQYNRAFGDASDMIKILQIEPEIADPANPEKVKMNRGGIEFNSVTFAHDEDKEALFHNLNLYIKPGEKIGLVGHSGSGKTTLTKLLLRFMDIDGGEITIDGQDITSVTQDNLRNRITYVPQEPLMFHRSIAENILYGNPEASDRQLKAVAKMAHAHDFVEKLPKKYDTLVGERGVKLSGGQRQRIAIARAMIKNAPILVLDEATSALDSESEVLIQDALWKLMEGRTAIVIAHRLSTIQKMDRIIVLDEGKIVEEGTHKELIRKEGTYASLWNHQTGGFLEN